MRIGIAGTMESNDCLITIKDSDKLTIEIESIVYDYFCSISRVDSTVMTNHMACKF